MCGEVATLLHQRTEHQVIPNCINLIRALDILESEISPFKLLNHK